MAQRYGYQFQNGMKPRMTNVEGWVSIGTGGLPNSVVGIASGGQLASSGTYYGILPGAATAGAPTGWKGTFSGTVGLYGAGVAGVARVGTGMYSIMLSDDWVRLDSVQLQVGNGLQNAAGGATAAANVIVSEVVTNTVGYGNTVTTGFAGASGLVGLNLKNQIIVRFTSSGTGVDLPSGGAFYVQLRLRDTQAGPQ